MAPRLSGQNCKFFKFPLSLNFQKRLKYKGINTKYRDLNWKPRSHVRILIYRTWPINACLSLLEVCTLKLQKWSRDTKILEQWFCETFKIVWFNHYREGTVYRIYIQTSFVGGTALFNFGERFFWRISQMIYKSSKTKAVSLNILFFQIKSTNCDK